MANAVRYSNSHKVYISDAEIIGTFTKLKFSAFGTFRVKRIFTTSEVAGLCSPILLCHLLLLTAN